MNKEEAKLYFADLEDSDLEDYYMDRLFEFKQFFISKPPISKVFLSKLNKASRLHEAYKTLGGIGDSYQVTTLKYEPSLDLGKSFTQYQALKNQVKAMVMGCKSFPCLEKLINEYIRITKLYAQDWSHDYNSYDGVKVSVEPDPMTIHKALVKFSVESEVLRVRLIELDSENVLLAESKRLSLWLKMENNV